MKDTHFDNGPYTDRFNAGLLNPVLPIPLPVNLRCDRCLCPSHVYDVPTNSCLCLSLSLSLSIYIYNLLGPLGYCIFNGGGSLAPSTGSRDLRPRKLKIVLSS